MSEERFDRIDERFDRTEVRLDRLEQGQQAMRTKVGELRAGQESLRAELRAGQEELRRHMGVLHEEVMDRIQALTFDPDPLRREFRAADDAVREDIGRRLDPIEAAFRSKRRE